MKTRRKWPRRSWISLSQAESRAIWTAVVSSKFPVYTFCSLKTSNVSITIQLSSRKFRTCDVWYNFEFQFKSLVTIADNHHIIFQWHPFVERWNSNGSIKSLCVRRTFNDDDFVYCYFFSTVRPGTKSTIS